MRHLLALAALVCLPSVALAQRGAAAGSADDAAIRKAIEDHYFKAQATGSGEHLKGTFVDEGRMMWVQDGQLRVRTSADYIGGFTGKPADNEAQRKRRVLMTDATGDVGVAKVELDFPDVKFTDYFALARVGGAWKIIHKTYHRQPKTK